ncbi:MAG: Epimerase family protein [Syntrophaceae bacterium PtaB.Bin038]|nr:MAG: Epimerase family protein [Syntrophaceae bacterium PtaB.Bin038]
MKVFMTGGTGFVGTTLARELTAKGHSVTVLMRKGEPARNLPAGARALQGDPTVRGAWQEEVPGHEVFINLAGASIFTRWTDEAKRIIRESRILTTRHLVEAMAPRKGKETHLFSTSGAGYYGYHGDEELTEESPPGTDFLALLSRDWEGEALRAKDHGARVVLMRFGIVMGRSGGMLGEVVPVFRMFLGADLGSGSQWLSWIHEMDLARIFLFLIEENRALDGPVNCTAPEPVRNREFTKTLGGVLGVPTFLPPVPGFMLRLIKGEFGSVILRGQRVLPRKLLQAGFRFRYPTLEEALTEILRK